MLNSDTELIFPIRLLPETKNLRGLGWKLFIERIMDNDIDLVNKVAITLLIAKLSGCVTCNADSYRANRGCRMCSQQAIRRCKNSDIELEGMFKKIYIKTKKYIEKKIFT